MHFPFHLNHDYFHTGLVLQYFHGSSKSEVRSRSVGRYFDPFCIHRLNSGNFRTFEPSELIFNLSSLNCRAPEIIFNDTELEPVSWGPRVVNTLFNFSVGVGVGGNDVVNLQDRHPFD